jgi:hypothetical protein
MLELSATPRVARRPRLAGSPAWLQHSGRCARHRPGRGADDQAAHPRGCAALGDWQSCLAAAVRASSRRCSNEARLLEGETGATSGPSCWCRWSAPAKTSATPASSMPRMRARFCCNWVLPDAADRDQDQREERPAQPRTSNCSRPMRSARDHHQAGAAGGLGLPLCLRAVRPGRRAQARGDDAAGGPHPAPAAGGQDGRGRWTPAMCCATTQAPARWSRPSSSRWKTEGMGDLGWRTCPGTRCSQIAWCAIGRQARPQWQGLTRSTSTCPSWRVPRCWQRRQGRAASASLDRAWLVRAVLDLAPNPWWVWAWVDAVVAQQLQAGVALSAWPRHRPAWPRRCVPAWSVSVTGWPRPCSTTCWPKAGLNSPCVPTRPTTNCRRPLKRCWRAHRH